MSQYLDAEMVQRLNQMTLSGRRVVDGAIAGAHRSVVRGASVEFRQHRAYVPGDEPRRLDWRVLARTDRPFVREFDQETILRAVLVLDGSGSMAYGRGQSKHAYASRVVAGLAYLMLGQRESVGLAVAEEGRTQWLGPQGGTGQLARVIDMLERSSPQGKADISRALANVAGRVGRRSLIVVVSDFFEPVKQLRDAFARLRHPRHEVIALRVMHRDEVEFGFRNWIQFRGLEGERSRLCEPAMMRQTYMRSFEAHRRALETSCATLSVELHLFMTDHPVADSLAAFLTHRAAISQRMGRR